MGRKSKLTEKQWAVIGERFLAGESARKLGKEFGVSEGAIRLRFSTQHKQIKSVANQILTTERALKDLPIATQIATHSYAARLRATSDHLMGAAEFGAATSHRLHGIANAQVQKIDDADPLGAESILIFQGVSALTKLANESASIPMGLLAANKAAVEQMNQSENAASPADLTDDELNARIARARSRITRAQGITG